MLNLLAFDYGAGSGRAMLGRYDGVSLVLDEIHRFPNEPVRAAGSLYWDILRLYHEMKQGIIKCRLATGHIESIGVDTWGVDFGLLDASGKLLGNPFHYRDTNTAGMIDAACKVVPRREIYDRTGIQFLEFNTLYQLLSMKLANSPLLEKAHSLLFTPDLLRYFLTGEKSSEYTIASTSQMMNPATGDWETRLLGKLGIPSGILTGIVDAGSIAGRVTPETASELGINAARVVAVAEHDTASAVVSVPATGKEFAYLSCGTWSLLGIESPTPLINDAAYRYDYTNEGGFGRTVRFLKNITGLWILQECKREWDKEGDSPDYGALLEAASTSAPFLALIDPDDQSFRRPGDMPEKVRKFCGSTGQRIPETRGEIVRCILESLALKYRMAVGDLEAITGYSIPVLHMVGGGCRNPMLCRFTANALARPVIAGPVEATAAGNLIVQLIALGELKGMAEGRDVIRKSFPVAEYIPGDRAVWDAAYSRFRGLPGNIDKLD